MTFKGMPFAKHNYKRRMVKTVPWRIPNAIVDKLLLISSIVTHWLLL